MTILQQSNYIDSRCARLIPRAFLLLCLLLSQQLSIAHVIEHTFDDHGKNHEYCQQCEHSVIDAIPVALKFEQVVVISDANDFNSYSFFAYGEQSNIAIRAPPY